MNNNTYKEKLLKEKSKELLDANQRKIEQVKLVEELYDTVGQLKRETDVMKGILDYHQRMLYIDKTMKEFMKKALSLSVITYPIIALTLHVIVTFLSGGINIVATLGIAALINLFAISIKYTDCFNKSNSDTNYKYGSNEITNREYRNRNVEESRKYVNKNHKIWSKKDSELFKKSDRLEDEAFKIVLIDKEIEKIVKQIEQLMQEDKQLPRATIIEEITNEKGKLLNGVKEETVAQKDKSLQYTKTTPKSID